VGINLLSKNIYKERKPILLKVQYNIIVRTITIKRKNQKNNLNGK
jgi:hypothetical protein